MTSITPAPTALARGAAAEALAVALIQKAGGRIVSRNYRCRGGEVDIIALVAGVVVFVEVRLRRASAFASASESITYRKQRRIALAAEHFLQRFPEWRRWPCRFDCICFRDLAEAGDWFVDAFSV